MDTFDDALVVTIVTATFFFEDVDVSLRGAGCIGIGGRGILMMLASFFGQPAELKH